MDVGSPLLPSFTLLVLISNNYEVNVIMQKKMMKSKSVFFRGSRVVAPSAQLVVQRRRETPGHLPGITVNQLRYMRGVILLRRYQQVTSLQRQRDPLPAPNRRVTSTWTLWPRTCEE